MSYKQNNPLSRKNSPLNKDDRWIQDAFTKIKDKGTEGVCSGDNFGSESCPPGSKRYTMAKTLRKMAKNRKDEGMSRHGSMKGDQSATHVDYANYKGTDKGYHGHTGASHGDQSATHRDYMVDHRRSPLSNAANIYGGWRYSRELRDMPLTKDMTKRDNGDGPLNRTKSDKTQDKKSDKKSSAKDTGTAKGSKRPQKDNPTGKGYDPPVEGKPKHNPWKREKIPSKDKERGYEITPSGKKLAL